MIAGVTPEQRARDGRLAWIVVGICAIVSLALVVVLARIGYGFAVERIAEDQRVKRAELEARAQAAVEEAERTTKDAPWYKPDGKIPVDVAVAPPPPNSTRPIGSPANWIGSTDYPASALRDGVEGRVRVTVSVSAQGVPLGCAVAESSGNWALDNATCAAMLNKGRFAPAPRGYKGRTYWTSPHVRWELPD